ncbi:MAG: ribbon-helix-helix protein, CopG family [Nanoarchaeota archaeon]
MAEDMMITKTFSIKLSQFQTIDKIAKANDKSRSEIVREAFDLYESMNRDEIEKAKKKLNKESE